MSTVVPTPRSAQDPAERPRGRVPPRSWVDALLVARRPGYLFSHSFFLDEGWVADSVRAPLSQLRLLTSSTPIGWTLLLRLVPTSARRSGCAPCRCCSGC